MADELLDLQDNGGLPDKDGIATVNHAMLLRQKNFKTAAEYAASGFAEVAEVEKIILFGSVAAPLKKEIPRFRELRRAGIAVWHECSDVDLAVWLADLGCLRSLQKARSQALNTMLRERNIGVAHHEVDVFLMEPGTDRYLGRLCCFSKCPKGKDECRVPGCGATPFLRLHEKFVFDPDLLKPGRTILLYERGSHPAGGFEMGEPRS